MFQMMNYHRVRQSLDSYKFNKECMNENNKESWNFAESYISTVPSLLCQSPCKLDTFIFSYCFNNKCMGTTAFQMRVFQAI